MSATVVVHSPEVAGYGRHAAPPSAYGPSDVHRLLPVSPAGSREAERPDSEDALVQMIDPAVAAEVVAAGDGGTDARSSGEVRTRATGIWARLRQLPKAA